MKRTDINVRKANINDRDSIFKLLYELELHHTKNYPDVFIDRNQQIIKEEINKNILDRNEIMLIAEVSDGIAGFSAARVEYQRENSIMKKVKYLEVNAIIIDSKYRNLGIGTILLNAMKNISYKYNCEELRLMVWSSNDSVEEFYKKNKFEKIYSVFRCRHRNKK